MKSKHFLKAKEIKRILMIKHKRLFYLFILFFLISNKLVYSTEKSYATENQLISNLEYDVWNYYRHVTYVKDYNEKINLLELINITCDHLHRYRITNELFSENCNRFESRSKMYAAFAYSLVDKPSKSKIFYDDSKKLYNAVEEGYFPDDRSKLEPTINSLVRWFKQFGYAEIYFINFQVLEDWSDLEVSLTFNKVKDERENSKKEHYCTLIERNIITNLSNKKYKTFVALLPGKYYFSSNSKIIQNTNFEIIKKDTIIVNVNSKYFFTLSLRDTTGIILDPKGDLSIYRNLSTKESELSAEDLMIYYEGKRVKNLEECKFGTYAFYGKGKYHIDENRRYISFKLRGSSIYYNTVQANQIHQLNHGDHFYYSVSKYKKPWWKKILWFLY